jgi:hypothetical protein
MNGNQCRIITLIYPKISKSAAIPEKENTSPGKLPGKVDIFK